MNILIVGSGAREHAIAAALPLIAARKFLLRHSLNPASGQMAVEY